MAETEQFEEAEQGQHPEACTARMANGDPCCRPVHLAPAGIDEIPACLMHSRDPKKDKSAFKAELEEVVRAQAEGEADFTGFVFPRADFFSRRFEVHCIFAGATFMDGADFSTARFLRGVDFSGCVFTKRAEFVDAKFHGRASFSQAVFGGDADFTKALFKVSPIFSEAEFKGNARFIWASFAETPFFGTARFLQDAIFVGATFAKGTHFMGARFGQQGMFQMAKFIGEADFSGAQFAREVNFWHATFEAEGLFRDTTFREDGTNEPGPVFGLARFRKPEAVVFSKNYLGQALFHNCDVSRFIFSDVRWRTRPENGKRLLFEEVVHLAGISDLKPAADSPGERNYRLIAETYQQLKKNYDDRRDYWTAGDFHYGEMEMKRLSSLHKSSTMHWLHRNLGLVALYKYASEFGESYVRPAVWVLFFLLSFFPTLYPLIGLKSESRMPISTPGQTVQATRPQVVSYALYIRSGGHPSAARSLTIWELLGDSERTSVDAALLRPNLSYFPIGGWGWLAMRVEFGLSATLFALFLLALRRQFRR